MRAAQFSARCALAPIVNADEGIVGAMSIRNVAKRTDHGRPRVVLPSFLEAVQPSSTKGYGQFTYLVLVREPCTVVNNLLTHDTKDPRT